LSFKEIKGKTTDDLSTPDDCNRCDLIVTEKLPVLLFQHLGQ